MKKLMVVLLLPSFLFSKNVLIIGKGGREHAIAWKMAQSEFVKNIYVAPGNAGTANEYKTENIAIDEHDFEGLIAFAQHNNIDLTIVGPESPLANGIVDEFEKHDLPCVGPRKIEAQIEASKDFAKQFMQQRSIPTAQYQSFTDAQKAKSYVKKQKTPIVIKADGLASGKGVVVAQSHEQACDAIDQMLVKKRFGKASQKIIIEEFIQGVELSFIVATDGTTIKPLETAQDYKRLIEGNKGPLTGGMGCISPAHTINPTLHKRIMDEIIKPTINGLSQGGLKYKGFLYAGLMITPEGDPKVLEFNCRLGDPEAQVLLLRLKNDLFLLCQAIYQENLSKITLEWDSNCSICVICACQGYPIEYEKGFIITGLEELENDYKIFHAGTIQKDNTIVTNGGRILGFTTNGGTFEQARKKIYNHIKTVSWPGIYYRRDIGFIK